MIAPSVRRERLRDLLLGQAARSHERRARASRSIRSRARSSASPEGSTSTTGTPAAAISRAISRPVGSRPDDSRPEEEHAQLLVIGCVGLRDGGIYRPRRGRKCEPTRKGDAMIATE